MDKRTGTVKLSSAKLLKLMRDNLSAFTIDEQIVNYCIDGTVRAIKTGSTTMVLTITDEI